MSKNNKSQKSRRQKLERRKKKRRLRQKELSAAAAARIPTKTDDRLRSAYELIEDSRFEEAEALLKGLAKRKPRNPAIAEALLFLHQASGNHEACCVASRRLMKLTPGDPDAIIQYAQTSLFCARVCQALVHYRRFVDGWPNHEYADKAKAAMDVCLPECRERVDQALKYGFMDLDLDEGGLELYALHESTIERLHDHDLSGAVEICEQILETSPNFVPARNNLTTAEFHRGNVTRALSVVRETRRLFPQNQYALALHGQHEFLNGNIEEAHHIADAIAAAFPQEVDPLLATGEFLGYLGRDDDILRLCQVAAAIDSMDPEHRAIFCHLEAFVRARQGEIDRAQALWRESLEYNSDFTPARENLADLRTENGHAPWVESFKKWIPETIINKALDNAAAGASDVARAHPAMISLVPALLDRSDPVGREFALRFAMALKTPPLIEALRTFAFSQRGPDGMRSQALLRLKELGEVGNGPHRVFSDGRWTEITLRSPEIYDDPDEDTEPWEIELSTQAQEAMLAGDLESADLKYAAILRRNPDSLSAQFNQAVAWQQLGDENAQADADRRIREIHARHPDYSFATIAVANLISIKGDHEKAGKMLSPLMERDRLHVSEAAALFAAQTQIAIRRRDSKSAKSTLAMLEHLNGPDHPTVEAISDLLEYHDANNRLNKLTQQFEDEFRGSPGN